MIKWNNYVENECYHRLNDIKVDPAFRKLSKNSICFHIWKVEEDRIDSIPKLEYGTFYDDCCYIIYAANTPGNYVNQDTITRELKNPSNIERYIHLWLGNKISPQKSGNIVYKIMELDTYFGYMTTQFRETQENESSRFLSYFKGGIRILCDSTSTSTTECKLFQIKGKKSPKCIEQETISWDCFSSTYAMLLKTPTCLFIWIGRSTSLAEKRNALNIANKMQQEYQLSDLIIIDDGYEQSMNEMHKLEWNRCLALKNRFVHEPPLIDQKPEFSLKLYKCHYNGTMYRVQEHKNGQPLQSDLTDSEAVYIIDGVSLGIWIWVGKMADQMEKTEAMRNARGFVKKKKYPSSTPVIKVTQDCEPIEFRRLFATWTVTDSMKKLKSLSKLDSPTLFQRPKLAAETQLIDDGTGERHIFRITDGRYSELIGQKNSIFFSNDCYLIHYITILSDSNTTPNNCNSGIRLIVYFWIGNTVPSDIRKKCESSAKNYFENLDKHTMIVRVKQGYETPHFLQMFGGKFIVFNGTKNNVTVHSDVTVKIPQTFILKIYGDSTFTSKAFEVDSITINGNCQDRFIIKKDSIWIWCRQGSTGDARESAKNLASVLGEHSLVMETKEPKDFFKSFPEINQMKQENGNSNGNNNVANGRVTTTTTTTTEDIFSNEIEFYDKTRVSLYVSFQIQGNFYTQEILYFDQSDLTPEDVYFLDAGGLIFVWVGLLCTKDDRKTCWQAVKKFLQNNPLPRNQDTTIALIQQNGEPNVFTGYFDYWDKKFWNNHVTYDQMRSYLQKTVPNTNISIPAINGESEFDKYQKYPLSVLQQEVEHLPQGVDPIRKEIHLTHDDFVELFKMKFSEFDTLPVWKKQELKKQHKLF